MASGRAPPDPPFVDTQIRIPVSLARKLAVNVLVQAVGKIAIAALSLGTIAILTRHLGVDGFGEYRTVIGFMAFAQLFGNLGVHLVFVRNVSQPGADQSSLLGNGLSLRLIGSTAVLLIAAGIAWLLPYTDAVKEGCLIAVAGMAALGAHQMIVVVFQQHLKQTGPVVAEVLGALVLFGGVLLGTYLGVSVLAMITVTALGSVVTLIVSWTLVKRLVPFRLRYELAAWSALLIPAIPLALGDLLQLVSYRSDTILLSLLQPASVVGQYGVASRVQDTLIGISLMFSQLMIPVLARYGTEDKVNFRLHLQRALDVLSVGCVGATALIAAYALPIVLLIAGREFADAAVPLQILAATMAVKSIAVVFWQGAAVINEQKKMLWGFALSAILGLTSYLILIPRLGATGAAISTLVGETALWIFAIVLLARRTGGYPSPTIFIKSVIAGAIALWLAWEVLPATGLYWMIQGAIAGTVYVGIVVAIGAVPISLIRELLLARKAKQS